MLYHKLVWLRLAIDAVAQATVSTISGNPTAYSLDGGMTQATSVFADM
jgi:hypothetical protein